MNAVERVESDSWWRDLHRDLRERELVYASDERVQFHLDVGEIGVDVELTPVWVVVKATPRPYSWRDGPLFQRISMPRAWLSMIPEDLRD